MLEYIIMMSALY